MDNKINELAKRTCVDCADATAPLKGEALSTWLGRLGCDWAVVKEHHLSKAYSFDDFAGALAFVNRIGEVAEAEGHHPDIRLAWGHVGVDIWTHKVDGLTESDFILAAKIEQVLPA